MIGNASFHVGKTVNCIRSYRTTETAWRLNNVRND